MPLICIGPFCVPVTAVLPILLWALRPLWEALPEAVRVRITAAVKPIVAWLDENVLSVLRGSGKAAAPSKLARSAGAAGGNGHSAAPDEACVARLTAALDARKGALLELTSPEELAAAQQVSAARGCALVLDFTAPWCGPCQRIKPQVAELAAAEAEHLFALVDVDAHPDLQSACGVLVLPTFHVLTGGRAKPVAELRGGGEGTVERLRDALHESVKKTG